jgi:hypothetical protein
MLGRLAVCVSAVFALSGWIPSTASADWFATGLVGPVFAGRVGNPPVVSYGGSVGWWGASHYGFEVEASRTPDFFQIADVPDSIFSDSHVATLMFNGLYHLHAASVGGRVKPYVSAGAGWIRSQIGADADTRRAESSHLGVNVGGGAHAMFSERWGVGR